MNVLFPEPPAAQMLTVVALVTYYDCAIRLKNKKKTPSGIIYM
jgi:hypothetical protein